METCRAGDTSVELLSWSSAWMASVEGWWVERGKDKDEGGGGEWEMACMPSKCADGDMLCGLSKDGEMDVLVQPFASPLSRRVATDKVVLV